MHVYHRNARKAIVVDIDGTISNLSDVLGGGYQMGISLNEKIEAAEPIEPVVNLVKVFAEAGYAIVIQTARSIVHYEATVRWLKKHGIPFDMLYVTDHNDSSSYEKQKEEFYEHMKHLFHIEMVVEDLESCVRMWKSKGLKVLQPQTTY